MSLLKNIMKAIDEYNGVEELEDGDIVMFDLEGQQAMGNIEYVMTEGYFGLPTSKFYTPASPEEPVVLIRIWSEGEETEYMVGRLASEVTKMEDM